MSPRIKNLDIALYRIEIAREKFSSGEHDRLEDMKLGCHVSIAQGLSKAIDRAVIRKANTIQIFASSPRTWAGPNHDRQEISRFKEQAAIYQIDPVVIHAKYLVNLASPNPETVKKSKGSLIEDLNFAAKIGALGSIVHVGSHKGEGLAVGLEQIVSAGKEVLNQTPKKSWLILENTAGSQTQSVHKIGSRFEELALLVEQINSDRVKVCLDTQHSLASGYDVGSVQGFKETIREFDRLIGLDRLVVVHVNDSKFALGSGKDRHESVGKGQIGEKGLRLVLHHPKLRNLPFILETPALAKEETAVKEIAILKRLATS